MRNEQVLSEFVFLNQGGEDVVQEKINTPLALAKGLLQETTGYIQPVCSRSLLNRYGYRAVSVTFKVSGDQPFITPPPPPPSPYIHQRAHRADNTMRPRTHTNKSLICAAHLTLTATSRSKYLMGFKKKTFEVKSTG